MNKAASSSAQNIASEALELEHIIGYAGKHIRTMHYHPKLTKLIVYSIGGTIVLEDVNDKHKQDFLRGHDMVITTLEVSQTGKYLVSGQLGTIYSKIPEAPVILWDLSQMKIVNIFRGLKQCVTNVSMSPDEKFIAATSSDNVFIIWHSQDFSIVHNKVLEQPIGLISWKEIKKSGKYSQYILVTSIGSSVIINTLDFDVASMQYNLKSYACQLPASGLIRNYTTSFIDSKAEYLFAGTTGGEIVIFNIPNRIFKAAIPISNNGVLSFACTAKWIFAGSGDGKVKRLIGQESKWTLEAEVQLEGRVVSLSISNDEKELIAGTSSGKIYRILAATLDAMLHTEGHIESVNDIVFPANSNENFATIDDNGFILVWDCNEMNVITKCFPNVMNKVKGCSVTFTDDDGVAGGWSDGFIRCYDMGKAKYATLRWEIVTAHKGATTTLFIDKNYILSGGEDGIVRVWSRKTRNLLTQISIHKKTVCRVFPDLVKPNYIHSCSQDKSLHTYDLKTEKKIILHQAKNGILFDMSQRKDHEQELVTCGLNTPIQFWDCDVAEPVDTIEIGVKLLTVEVSPTGKYLAVASDQAEIFIFDIATKKFMGKYIGHSTVVNKLKWSPDEKQIISVSADASVCVWNFFG